MPQLQQKRRKRSLQKKHPKRRHTKKSGNSNRRKHRNTLTGGSAGCEQAATIMEPGFTITSHLKDSMGFTIPSSRALLSGAMPSCNKGSHP